MIQFLIYINGLDFAQNFLSYEYVYRNVKAIFKFTQYAYAFPIMPDYLNSTNKCDFKMFFYCQICNKKCYF